MHLSAVCLQQRALIQARKELEKESGFLSLTTGQRLLPSRPVRVLQPRVLPVLSALMPALRLGRDALGTTG